MRIMLLSHRKTGDVWASELSGFQLGVQVKGAVRAYDCIFEKPYGVPVAAKVVSRCMAATSLQLKCCQMRGRLTVFSG